MKAASTKGALILLSMFSGFPAAGAQPERPDAQSLPQAEEKSIENVPEQIRFFVGNWSVDAADPGTKEVTKIDYRVEPVAGGKWLTGIGESSDRSVRARDQWGVDPANGDILRFVFDSSGAYGIVRSRGWEGDRLVLEGEAYSRGGGTKVRETLTRVGDGFDAVWEALQNGSWTAYSIEQVRRQ